MHQFLIGLIAGNLFFCLSARSQASPGDTDFVERTVHLDEVVVRAERGGFNIRSFIRRVEEDTTFYKAFKTLRLIGYTAGNDIRIFKRSGKLKASMKCLTRQVRRDGCRSMSFLDDTTTGNFYTARGTYRYYTAELYASLFFTRGSVCGETNIVAGGRDLPTAGAAMEHRKDQLKTLIFDPGQPVGGIPVVGGKVAIFDPGVAPLYDFTLNSGDYAGIPCYIFSARAKPEYARDVVINYLVTYFDKLDFSIVARDYSLSFRTLLFDFDVTISVEMTRFQGMLLPSLIRYRGNWDIPFHRREIAKFQSSFFDFNLGDLPRPDPPSQ